MLKDADDKLGRERIEGTCRRGHGEGWMTLWMTEVVC